MYKTAACETHGLMSMRPAGETAGIGPGRSSKDSLARFCQTHTVVDALRGFCKQLLGASHRLHSKIVPVVRAPRSTPGL